MIYLDNAATTFPKPECVYEAMDKANREMAVNAGRGSYKAAREASALISETKGLLRRLVNADISASVVFSPSITIALNQVIDGLSLNSGEVVYVSPYEHNAVARTVHKFSCEKGIIVKLLPLDEKTLEIDLEKMKYEFSKDKPKVVICTHVSNVTGYILPIKEIFEAGKEYGSINILDSAQSLGLVEVDSRNLLVDIIAFAGHKTLYGPFGIGGFINLTGVPLSTFITGGTGSDSLNLDMPDSPEGKYEAASSNIVAIAGLKAAIECIDIPGNYKHEKELTDYTIEKLSGIRGIKVLSYESGAQIGIVSFMVNGMQSDNVGLILDEDYDIAVRTGYHCAPYIHGYIGDKDSNGTVRIGIGQFTSFESIDSLVKALSELG